MVEIRSFHMNELDEIITLYRDVFKSNGEDFKAAVLQASERNLPGDVLIAVEENRIVGFASFVKRDHWHFGPFCITPLKQNKGIGNVLLTASLNYMKKAGGGRITLTVQKNNAAAIALYKKFGFLVTSYIMKLE